MKHILKTLIITIILVISVSNLPAQAPPHPNGGASPAGGNNTKVGGGAPIGSGNFLLIGLALLYATKKSVSLRRQAEA
jgi:hypothetical protein